MSYYEFRERLEWYFSRRDINELDRIAYESADTALREPDDKSTTEHGAIRMNIFTLPDVISSST